MYDQDVTVLDHLNAYQFDQDETILEHLNVYEGRCYDLRPFKRRPTIYNQNMTVVLEYLNVYKQSVTVLDNLNVSYQKVILLDVNIQIL